VDIALRLYWKVTGSLLICDDLIYSCSMIVLTKPLHIKSLVKIHNRHYSIEICQLRVKSSVWWHGITNQLTQRIELFKTSSKTVHSRKNSFLTIPVSELSWQIAGTYLMELKGVR